VIRYAYWNYADFKNDKLMREGVDDAYWTGFKEGSAASFTNRPIRGFKKDELQ